MPAFSQAYRKEWDDIKSADRARVGALFGKMRDLSSSSQPLCPACVSEVR
jgi:hypothetical protein